MSLESQQQTLFVTVDQFKTDCAIEAYKEEFKYFAIEGGVGFISLCKELFIDDNGKEEARKINWQWIENRLDVQYNS